MLKIYVDADACPVKSEVLRVGARHGAQIYIVSNGGIRPSDHPLVQTVIVDQSPDAADQWIVEDCGSGDLVVTTDIPLAALAVEKGAEVIKPNGEVITEKNIGTIVASRNLMADIRGADPFFQSKGKAFSNADRSRFLNNLERLLRQKR